MKVYVVQRGEYSDRHIVGVALTEEKANELVRLFQDPGDYGKTLVDTEVFDTEDNDYKLSLDAQGLKPYGVSEYHHQISSCYALSNDWRWYTFWNSVDIGEVFEPYENECRVVVYARDKDHAIKIASDKFAEHRYNKEVEGLGNEIDRCR